MIITVINHSGTIADETLHDVIRAINRQIHEDFEPYWSLGATLRLEGRSRKDPDKLSLPDMRGDAVLYLWDKADVPGALGYHDENARGIPFGFVFTELSQQVGENWTVTLSHEAIELIADPLVNLLVAGPHPTEDRTVFHWYEMSDAVQAESYKCDGVDVSNFLLPLYFTPDAEAGSRNDYLGREHQGKLLTSFGVNPGGYIGFFDPQLGKHVTFANAGDDKAKKRLKIKSQAMAGRRAYRLHTQADEPALQILNLPRIRAAATATKSKSGRDYEQIDE